LSNICGKAYGLTAITRMHPVKTWGVRIVFFLITICLQSPAVRGFAGGVLAGLAAVLVLGVAQLFGFTFSLVMWLGTRFLDVSLAAWALGFVLQLAVFGALGAALGSVYQPKWTLLGQITQIQENLINLSFIHFARWVIIPRGKFPRLGAAQPREQLHYDYFLFESNFNGDWEKYIDAFSQVVPGGMDNIWRWSVKYPMSKPISPFLTYIRNCQYDTDHYYSAYPGAATNDVRGALTLVAELERFERASATLAPADFARAYTVWLAGVQNCLSRTGPPPSPAPAGPRVPADVRIGTMRGEAAHV
jgi:hypothetical protein